jgi:ABC-type glutathione transport system ATPase component
MNALSVAGLTVAYGKSEILRDISFDVENGDTLGIVGRTGAGKTTLLAAVLGLLPKGASMRARNIQLLGRDVRKASTDTWKRLRHVQVAYVPQHARASLHPYLRIGRQLTEVLKTRGLDASRDEQGRRLESLHIRDPARVLDAFPHELSGGMAQRVCIGMAVAADPPLLLADEPASGLDLTLQREILELLRGVASGRTLMLISHDLRLVGTYCNSAVVLRAGEIVEQGPAEVLLRNPAHEYTRHLTRAYRWPD